MLSGQADVTEQANLNGTNQTDGDDEEPFLRGNSRGAVPRVKARAGKHIEGYNELDEMDDESDAPSSGNEWDSGAEEEADEPSEEEDGEDEDIAMSDDDEIIAKEEKSDVGDDSRSQSLMVSLRYSKLRSSPVSTNATNGTPGPEQDNAAVSHHQVDPVDLHQDPQNDMSPTGSKEHIQSFSGSSNSLPIKDFSNSLSLSGQKPSAGHPEAPLQANSASSASLQVDAPAKETSEEPEATKMGGLPDFRQYQYQPPT